MDKVIARRHLAGIVNLTLSDFFGVETVADVITDATREEAWLLRHNRYLALVPLLVKVLDINTREEDLALLWVIISLNQLDQARLAATRLSH